MTPTVPMPESTDKEAIRQWMKDIRDARPQESRDIPTTPEEFAAAQQNRLLRSVGISSEPGRRRMDVALTGEVTVEHVVPVTTLGSFLTNFQESVSSVAQSLAGRPTNSASIPRDIREATALSAAATFPSSFGVVIYGPPQEAGEVDLFGDQVEGLRTILDDAVERLLNIVDLSEGAERFDDMLAEQLAPLGARSMKHIGALTAGLYSAGVGMRFSWYAQGGRTRNSSWSPSGVQRVRYLCEHSDFSEAETVNLVGWLGSASAFSGKIEIRVDGGDTIQASTNGELMERLDRYFNKRVEAVVEVTKVQFAGGRERKIYSVIELRNL